MNLVKILLRMIEKDQLVHGSAECESGETLCDGRADAAAGTCDQDWVSLPRFAGSEK